MDLKESVITATNKKEYIHWEKAKEIYEILREFSSAEKNFILKLVERVWDCDDLKIKREKLSQSNESLDD